jgi:hypothetical protein
MSGYQILVLNGHKSHQSVKFKKFCKTNNIIIICLPAHSSYLTQPLNIDCFSPLKKAYSKKIRLFIQTHINHITKVKFFLAFHAAYNTAMTKENIAEDF